VNRKISGFKASNDRLLIWRKWGN